MPSNEMQSVVDLRIRNEFAAGSILTEDPFTGSLLRLAIADHALVASMFKSLGGNHEAHACGTLWGQLFYAVLASLIESAKMITVRTPRDFLKEEFVEHLNAQFSYAGLGQFRITEGNKYYMIDLHNPAPKDWPDGPRTFQALMAGFFSELFSRLADKPLVCLPLEGDGSRWRFALSRHDVIEEVRGMVDSGRSLPDIHRHYKNDHLI